MNTRFSLKSPLLQSSVLALFCIFIGSLIIRSTSDYNHSKERGRFVLSILKQDRKELALKQYMERDLSQATTKDLLPILQVWLVKQLLIKSPPQMASVHRRLIALEIEKPEIRVSLQRWESGLARWMNSEARNPNRTLRDMLNDGRIMYNQATGYRNIGREVDATVLYLGSFDLLSRYIEASPTSPEVPEALFLLGMTRLRLSKSLPACMRSNRLINLCVELYPDSIWANLSRANTREHGADVVQHSLESSNDI